MSERVAAAWLLLPEYLAEHVLLSAAAMALGLVLSLGLAIAAIRSTAVRWPVLAFASLVQTIPGLALLALFYPLLLAASTLATRLFGVGFSALGFLPSLLALTLYSMLPVIRNGVTGVVNLDPAVIEAARAVGMTERQRLWRVELPLASPMLMAGVRTAAVWVIGAATLSTPVGQTSLGNFIFAGLQIQNWVSVLFGCVSAAALAMLVDSLLGLIENGIARRSRWRVAAGGAGTAVRRGHRGSHARRRGARDLRDRHQELFRAVHSGGAPGAQGHGGRGNRQPPLGARLGDRVRGAGQRRHRRLRRLQRHDLGERHASQDVPTRDAILDEMRRWLAREHGIVLLGSLGFENAYALAMRRDRASSLGIESIADLAAHASHSASAATWSSSRGRSGLRYATAMASRSSRDATSSRHSCTKPSPAARSM